ncbi:hypothetical protein AA0113_g4506 [Alternaria arborescens]|uniref:Uncharacterized protein n=1 Tax=Alternaria arborescens TaxID=156630 RepID=A0A4Q4SB78_9PLEO|nr:hypothetical protein AA0111_g12279 [Alternaria arborescens]RYN41856.1 hypothetical protein AA0112_g1987 [Alternaria arborescens]RYO13332.1 hypothetical protein AA0111_g12279 [Alternaria arborescens]RYO67574.1 hypothetical protein AA0113_g4506 [Alternaria arborescens]
MINITFPQVRDDWSLDVVNILAFLGEHNIIACSQQICMSWTCFLPRLIPAPQGLLAQRPKKLASEDETTVTGVWTGNNRPVLQYFGRMLHTDGSDLSPFTTRLLKIQWDSAIKDKSLKKRYPIRPRLFSPMNMIAVLSCAMTFGLAGWALALGDAVALTGILVMSFTTPLLCLGMCWTPRMVPRYRPTRGLVPPGTVVIKSSNGCFTVVECDEQIARLLYFHPEYIDYAVSSFTGRGLSGTVGGLTLVGSIVLFGNAVWALKAALAVTYTVLNLLYWVAAILPVRLSWHIDLTVSQPEIIEDHSFTQCLWTTIYHTKKIDWAREYVPKTEVWNQWLLEAENKVRLGVELESWDAFGALNSLLKERHKPE